MTILIIIGILGVIAAFMIYGSVVSQQWHRENRGRETLTETDHFHGHLIYFNSNDNRIFVPKQTGGGFTINFANPLSVIVGLLIIAGLIVL